MLIIACELMHCVLACVFRFAQFLVGLGRSRIPPLILVSSAVMSLSPDQFLDRILLADPHCVDFLQKVLGEVCID